MGRLAQLEVVLDAGVRGDEVPCGPGRLGLLFLARGVGDGGRSAMGRRTLNGLRAINCYHKP
jgi:hypothetical protein